MPRAHQRQIRTRASAKRQFIVIPQIAKRKSMTLPLAHEELRE